MKMSKSLTNCVFCVPVAMYQPKIVKMMASTVKIISDGLNILKINNFLFYFHFWGLESAL
jgi:hypothetical protein